MSGFGRTGPAAEYKAYAGNAAAFAGIAGAVRELSDPRAVGGSPFPDCKSALWAATLAAAWWLGGAEPYLFDLSMAEVVASDLNGLPLDVSSSPPPEVAPDLIMRCADGSVAVATGSRPYDEALAAVGLGESEVPIWRSYAEAVADLTATPRTVDNVLQALGTAGSPGLPVARDGRSRPRRPARSTRLHRAPRTPRGRHLADLRPPMEGGRHPTGRVRTAGTADRSCSARTTTGSTNNSPSRQAASELVDGFRKLLQGHQQEILLKDPACSAGPHGPDRVPIQHPGRVRSEGRLDVGAQTARRAGRRSDIMAVVKLETMAATPMTKHEWHE